jgi:hypothetical protein
VIWNDEEKTPKTLGIAPHFAKVRRSEKAGDDHLADRPTGAFLCELWRIFMANV